MCFFYTGSGYAKNVGMGPICKWKFAHPPPYYVTMLGALCDFFSHTRDTGSYQRNALWRPFRWNNHSAGRFFKINNSSFVGRFSEIFDLFQLKNTKKKKILFKIIVLQENNVQFSTYMWMYAIIKFCFFYKPSEYLVTIQNF